jgi:hypothetical protein
MRDRHGGVTVARIVPSSPHAPVNCVQLRSYERRPPQPVLARAVDGGSLPLVAGTRTGAYQPSEESNLATSSRVSPEMGDLRPCSQSDSGAGGFLGERGLLVELHGDGFADEADRFHLAALLSQPPAYPRAESQATTLSLSSGQACDFKQPGIPPLRSCYRITSGR